MRSLRTYFVAAALISTAALTASPPAKSGEKRCRTISTCNQPAPVACTSSASQPAAPTQTCCQPAVSSVQPKIELVAYARPAAPRRLAPQPDALDISRTTAGTACAIYLVSNYGPTSMYYGIRCSDQSSVAIYGIGLGPLPGNCNNPNGACISYGSSVVPTAFQGNTPSSNGSLIQSGVRLAQKRKAGQEPSNPVNALATGTHQLKERTRVGQPTYIKIPLSGGANGFVVAELQRYFVKGTGKSGEEHSATFAVGTEVDAIPAGMSAKEIERQKIEILADHVARVTIGNVTYDIVTATKLVP